MRTLTYLFTLFLLGGTLGAQTSPTQLADIRAGAESSSPTRFFEYNGVALFRANDGVNGTELWVTDGTPAGTSLLKDINPGTRFGGSSNPSDFIEYNGLVYFAAQSSDEGRELWVTDGTEAGTQLVADIQAGPDPGAPRDFVVYNDLLYFTATDATSSSELWVSDGTAAGTQLAVDINPGGGVGNPNFKFVFRGVMWFTANDGVNGTELFISNGTPAGTQLVSDINPTGNANPGQYHTRGNSVFFRADDGTTGRELWSTNGTAAGTFRVADIATGAEGSDPDNFVNVGSSLFFTADDNTGNGEELWRIDFSMNPVGFGTFPVTNPGEIVEIIEDSYSVLVADGPSGARDFILLNGLGASVGVSLGGATYGDLGDNDPRDLVWSGNSLYFTYEDDDANRQLAGVDIFGNTGVTLFDPTDITGGDSEFDEPFVLGGQLLFEANDGATGRELYSVTGQNAIVDLVNEDGETIETLDSLDFGIVTQGMPDTSIAFFSNVGNAPARLIDFSRTNSTDTLNLFSLRLANGELSPNPGTAALIFEIDASSLGAFQDTVTVEYTTNGGSEFRAFFVTGRVVAPSFTLDEDGIAIADGDQLDFLGVAVGEDSTRTITVLNDSEGTLVISDIALADGTSFSVSPSGADTLAAGESLDLDVTYSDLNAMDATDQLIITTNAGVQTINLNGTYLREPALRAELEGMALTSGDQITYTDVQTFTDSTQTVIVSNDGLGDLIIDTAALTIGTFFSVSEVMDDTLETGESISIDVTYSPESVGTETDVLTLTTNQGDFILDLNGQSILGSISEQGIVAKAAYPNPTVGLVTLELEETLQNAEWSVVDAGGRVLRSGTWPDRATIHAINLAELPNGVYQVIVSEGAKRVTARVIKR